ncbi:MAG: GerAB/ArcD/ProY family transporter [Oscillospiraceae bacterium]|nr:GerAB/ArcD/ProY family transporter [Oscillospiraceae bacterium]
MGEDKITSGAGAALCIMTLMTNAYSVMPGAEAGAGVWISHIAAGALALILALLFAVLCDAFPEKSFFGVLEVALGKFAGRLIAFFLAVASLLTCVVSLTVFSRFVQITALPQTPQIIIPGLVIVIAALSLRCGLRAASGSARLLVWFSVAVFLIYVIFGIGRAGLSLTAPDMTRVEPLLSGGGEVFLNRFGALPALMAIYVRMPKKGRRAPFFAAIGGVAAALCIIALITVATLGAETARTDFYPIYTAMSVRGVGGFIQHTEIFACIAMTLCLFFKSAVCLAFSDDMLSGVFSAERRLGAAMPLALICAASTQLIYRDISGLRGMVEWKSGAWFAVALYVAAAILPWLGERVRRAKTGKAQ